MSFQTVLAGLAAVSLSTVLGCAVEVAPTPTQEADVGVVERGGSAGLCWDGVTLPRPALEPTALASVAEKYAAYTVALDNYQAAAAAYSAAAQAHADAYNAVAIPITGQLCSTSADCDTGTASFVGACFQPYYGVGARCYVIDPAPLPAGPQPPVIPAILCGDLACPVGSNYACETEPNTGTNACILSRCATGGGGGGGGGGKH